MYTVFVTGPLASGKRTACEYLTQHGFAHIDTDVVAKEFLEDTDVIKELAEHYGSAILAEDGSIQRAKLAERAFAGEGTSDFLNGVIWPRVKAKLADVIVGTGCLAGSMQDKLVVEIPMLAEAPDMAHLADSVLCVTASPKVRLERAVARGMQREDAERRMALQASDEERAALCDYVIENDGALEELHRKLKTWLESQRTEHLF